MQLRDIRNVIRSAGRVLAWCFVVLGVGLAGFGMWLWLAHRNDDIGSVMGGLCLLGGVYLVANILPHVLKRR